MYMVRLSPFAGAVKRPPDAKKALPAWARKALANRVFTGATAGGRIPASRRSDEGSEHGWFVGGEFNAYPFAGRAHCCAVHPTHERVMVLRGEYMHEDLCEVDLESGEVAAVPAPEGSTAVYLAADRILTSVGGLRGRSTSLLGRGADGSWELLSTVRAGGRPLAGPFLLSCDGGVREIVLIENRVSITHSAAVVVVDGDALHLAGTVLSNEPHGFGGYGLAPFVDGGILFIKSQKKRPGGTAWYTLAVSPAPT